MALQRNWFAEHRERQKRRSAEDAELHKKLCKYVLVKVSARRYVVAGAPNDRNWRGLPVEPAQAQLRVAYQTSEAVFGPAAYEECMDFITAESEPAPIPDYAAEDRKAGEEWAAYEWSARQAEAERRAARAQEAQRNEKDKSE